MSDLTGIVDSVAAWQAGQELTEYGGRICQQFQSDLDRYAELIQEFQPPFVIEIGSAAGGTALFLADAIIHSSGSVYSVDIEPVPDPPSNPRLTFLTGSSLSDEIIDFLFGMASGQRGLVLLDGDHSSAQVEAELDVYYQLADYLVVQDTIMEYLHGHTDGPHIALAKWLPYHPEFNVDGNDPDPTQHPGGYLRRVEVLNGR